jgi:membrane protease YdiL (CAAX protease family)
MTEVLFVLLTVVAFQVGEYLGLKVVFIATAAVFWVTYVLVRWRRDPAVLGEWGFRRENLAPATVASVTVLLVVGGAMFALRLHRNPLWLPRNFWVTLALYPLWGVIQQFLMNGIIARNLARFMPPAATVLCTAVLFAVAHAPDGALMGLTFIAACIWVPIYLRWRNLWPLGVSHGLLGAIAYYVPMGRDVWLELTAGW